MWWHKYSLFWTNKQENVCLAWMIHALCSRSARHTVVDWLFTWHVTGVCVHSEGAALRVCGARGGALVSGCSVRTAD